MSGLEDEQNARTEENDTQEETIEEATRTSNEARTSPSGESNSSELSESISTRNTEEEREEIENGRIEREETADGEKAGAKEPEKEIDKEEERKKTQNDETSESELATVTKSTSSGDGVIALRQTEPGESKVEPISTATAIDDGNAQHQQQQQQQQQQQRHSDGPNIAAVGEWNSLPVLVERLRKALELSLAVSYRRGGGSGCGDESTTTSSADHVVGTDSERNSDRVYARCCSMERALLGGGGSGGDDDCDSELKRNELKFLEDLLLSDIQTALSRLRETLERTNVETLAKYGGASNPTSKLQLLRLVSSLLSRLQVPEKKTEGSENKTGTAMQIGGVMPFEQKRRAVRHTIGVSAEEIAHARRQLEESNANLMKLNNQMQLQKQEPSALPYLTNSSEKYVEEVRDKYTKDAINQRQSLRDKNKESSYGGDTSVYRPLIPAQIADRGSTEPGDSNARQTRRRSSVDSCQESALVDDEQTAMRKAKEEQNRVASLANALRQRADAVSANRCNNNNNNNKFTAKKSKIKRANTIDIPSYLKLQAENLGYDGIGCVSLRRPINVSDKIVSSPTLAVRAPSFQPRTENDKKFLALINRNNETQTFTAAPAFIKSFGYAKTADASSMSENWNSRFSNIKTAFDKPTMASDNNGNKPTSPNPHPAKRFPVAQIFEKTSGETTSVHNGFRNAPPDMGFRHAPSSLFQKIERSQNPKSPPGQQWQRNNAPFASTAVREKARTTFDRDNSGGGGGGGGGIRSQSSSKNENSQKSTFSRPPWIEHDRNERKPTKMVTENGRLDYRQFCKQFAPFVASKNAVPESKRSPQNILEHSKARGKNFVAPRDNKLDSTDGKISFKKATPERDSQMQQYRPCDLHPESQGLNRDRFSCGNKKSTNNVMGNNDENSPKSDVTSFKSNSSVATQTGGANNVNPPEEMRVYQAVTRNPLRAQNNASVQTRREPEMEQGTAFRCESASDNNNPTLESAFYPENPGHYVLDYNQNYRSPTEISVPRNETSPLANVSAHSPIGNVPVRATFDYSLEKGGEQIFPPSSPQNYFPSKSTIDTRRPETYQDRSSPYVAFATNQQVSSFENHHVSDETQDRENYERASDALPEEQNIQNQDISADAGVVTRYACAIATVASAENDVSPRTTRADDDEYRASLSTSPSSQFWSCPIASTTGSEVVTTEDEIRRHNILQQSLVCRLQNERATLNDYPNHHAIVPNQSAGFGQIDHTYNTTRSVINQAVKCEKSTKPRVEAASKRAELRKLEPPIVTGNLLALPSSSSGFGANRVTALKEQYEQPPALGHSTSLQKERSPIPTGTSDTMDSSDKYLASCASKPFRSIVLSKSESWHQLALTKKPSAVPPRPSHGGLLPLQSSSSYSPKPPKPKSTTMSSFRMKKQYEASSSSDSVKKMENKIRRYFDTPAPCGGDHDAKNRRFSSCNPPAKGMLGLSRSRTMPGICDERLRLSIPAPTSPQITNLNSAEVDRVFEDIFEEATRADGH